MSNTISINNPTDNPLGHHVGKRLMEKGIELVPLETPSDAIIDFSVEYSDIIIVMDLAFFRGSPTIIAFTNFSEEEKVQVEDYGYEAPVFITDGTEDGILAAVNFFLKEARKPRVYTIADIEV